jgi:hypothetical protein
MQFNAEAVCNRRFCPDPGIKMIPDSQLPHAMEKISDLYMSDNTGGSTSIEQEIYKNHDDLAM